MGKNIFFNGEQVYSKSQIDQNLKDLIKAMGLKDSDDNVKIFKGYLGITNGRKPLENESFNDYYKRTLKLFLKDMQKEAKRKLDEEGKAPKLDAKDILNKFDNLVCNIGELHNDNVEKKLKALPKEERAKVESAVASLNKNSNKSNKKTVSNKDIAKDTQISNDKSPKGNGKTPAAKPAPARSNGGNDAPLFSGPVFQTREEDWYNYVEEDMNAKDKSEEYLRRLRTYQRIHIEHFAHYASRSFLDFLCGVFSLKKNDSPYGWIDFDPDFTDEVRKKQMWDMCPVELDDKGKVANRDTLKIGYKAAAHHFLKHLIKDNSKIPTKEEITVACEEVDKIVQTKAPEDKKMHKHMGLSDSSFNDMQNEMRIESAVFSLNWIYEGNGKPLEEIVVKNEFKGEKIHKAYLAVKILKDLREMHAERSGISKMMHKEEGKKISDIESFLINKAGISKEFIEQEMKDPEIDLKLRECIEKEATLKANLEKDVNKTSIEKQKEEKELNKDEVKEKEIKERVNDIKDLEKDSSIKIKTKQVEKVKKEDKTLEKNKELDPLQIGPVNKNKKNN